MIIVIKCTQFMCGAHLDVVPEHLPVPLGTTLAQSFASLATTSHVACIDAAEAVTLDND